MTSRPMRCLLALTAAAVLSGAVGCKSDTEPIPGSPDDVDVYPRVTLKSRDLQEALGVQRPIETRTGAGNLVVTLPIRARTSNDAAIDHRIVWLDANGALIQPEVSWRYMRLVAKQPERLTYTATTDRAVDYNIQIKWSQR